MDNRKREAYTRMLFYVFLLLRNLSNTKRKDLWKPWEWVRLYRNMKKINTVSDAFHNLPYLLYEDSFNEEEFWNSLSKDLPMEYEYLKDDYDEVYQGIYSIPFELSLPWEVISDKNSNWRFVKELLTEIMDRDPLYYCKVYAIARRIDNDNVLFRLIEDRTEYFLVAHLTWNRSTPKMKKYDSIDIWKEQRMYKDKQEYV